MDDKVQASIKRIHEHLSLAEHHGQKTKHETNLLGYCDGCTSCTEIQNARLELSELEELLKRPDSSVG